MPRFFCFFYGFGSHMLFDIVSTSLLRFFNIQIDIDVAEICFYGSHICHEFGWNFNSTFGVVFIRKPLKFASQKRWHRFNNEMFFQGGIP